MVDQPVVPEHIVEAARRFEASGAKPVTPRVAATVMLLRPAPDGGFEAYVIRRVAAMAFGGMYAFPGGSVDPSDSRTDVEWTGPAADDWAARLRLPAEQAQAIVCAAAREVFEEAGVLLAGAAGASGSVVDDVSGDDWEAVRRSLVAHETGFAEVLRARDLALRSDLLAPWSRWITPESEPRRFDTYFFVAALPAGQQTRDVSGEADHTMWIRPADAVARSKTGEVAMLPPTAVNLSQIGVCSSIDEVFRAAAARDPAKPVTPRVNLSADGPGFLYD